MKKNIASGLALAIIFLACTGCATVVRHDIPVTANQPVTLSPQDLGEMTYSVTVHNNIPDSANIDMNGVSMSGSDWTVTEAAVSRGLRRYFYESGYFSSVRETKVPGEFHLAFDITMNPNPNETAASYVAGFTLFLFPIWYSQDCELAATLIENGVKKASFFAREEVTQVWWLPLLPIGLFKNQLTAEKEIQKNYVNALVVELREKGFLPVKRHGATTP